jgi:hypothetical protein
VIHKVEQNYMNIQIVVNEIDARRPPPSRIHMLNHLFTMTIIASRLAATPAPVRGGIAAMAKHAASPINHAAV